MTETTGAAPPLEDAPELPEQPTYEEPEDEDQPDLAEAEDDLDSEDDEPPGPREQDAEEEIEPKVDPIPRLLWSVHPTSGKREERVYTQKSFEYFQMTEFYGLLARAAKIVMEGESAVGMDEIFQMLQPKAMLDQMMQRLPGYQDAPDRADNEVDIDQAMKIMAAFANVISVAPDLLKESYLIILGVPKAHRNWALEWALPNMTQEEGEDVLETLIDQNWGVIERFFFRVLPRLARRAAKARERHASSGDRSRR